LSSRLDESESCSSSHPDGSRVSLKIRRATAFGTRNRQKRSGKGPEKMRQRCHFYIYRCLGTDYLEKYLIVALKACERDCR